MRSIFFLLSACSAVAQAMECQAADETTLFQGVRMGDSLVRKGMKATEAKSWDAQGLVKSLQHVANNLDTMSTDEVNQTLQPPPFSSCRRRRRRGEILPTHGFYRIQQKEGMKYLDAYESAQYNAVTRPWQNNPSQWWFLHRVGALEDEVYTIRQVGTNAGASYGRFGHEGFLHEHRYLDAHEEAADDFRVTTQRDQDNDSQQWHFTMVDDCTNAFTLNHGVNMRFLDAYVGTGDGQLVTRDEQGNDSQKWVLTQLAWQEEAQADRMMGWQARRRRTPSQAWSGGLVLH